MIDSVCELDCIFVEGFFLPSRWLWDRKEWIQCSEQKLGEQLLQATDQACCSAPNCYELSFEKFDLIFSLMSQQAMSRTNMTVRELSADGAGEQPSKRMRAD